MPKAVEGFLWFDSGDSIWIMVTKEKEIIFRLLEDKSFSHEPDRLVRRGMIEAWMEELGLDVENTEDKRWGKEWTIHPDHLPDFENAFFPTLESLANKNVLARRQAKILLVEGPMEMRYFHNRHKSFCVVTNLAALYLPLKDGLSSVPAPEIYIKGQNVYVFQGERYAWMPVISGRNGYGLPIPVVLAEIEMIKTGVKQDKSDEVITINPYEDIER